MSGDVDDHGSFTFNPVKPERVEKRKKGGVSENVDIYEADKLIMSQQGHANPWEDTALINGLS